MNKRTRLLILGVCAILFLLITPYTILYSLGYRVDFQNFKIVETGGIYIKAQPQNINVSVDYKIETKTSLFSNSVFIQNLTPKSYQILLRKDGYYDYLKSMEIKEREVTKLENVILFKNKIGFDLLLADADYFSISKDNNTLLSAKVEKDKITIIILNLQNSDKKELSLPIKNSVVKNVVWSFDPSVAIVQTSNDYFIADFSKLNPTVADFLKNAEEISFNPQNSQEIFYIKNKNIYSNLKKLPVIENAVSYKIEGQNITWLSFDGFLHNSSLAVISKNKINSKILPIKETGAYQIIFTEGKTLIKENKSLMVFNAKTGAFEIFDNQVEDFKISPNGQKLIYHNGADMMLSFINNQKPEKIIINKFSENIRNVHWINDDYIIFVLGDKIVISETDYRGNVNLIKLPNEISLSDLDSKTVAIKNPDILLNSQNKKLYILTENSLLVSEKLIP